MNVWIYIGDNEERTEGRLIYLGEPGVDTEILTWHVRSGPYGRGALPKGRYHIEPAVGIEKVPENAAFADKAGHYWWAGLKEIDWNSGRTGLGIHPDGNVPGTLGCLGLTAGDTSLAFIALRKGGVLHSV